MDHAKYVMVQYGRDKYPIVFPALLDHCEIAARLKAKHDPMRGAMTVVSAGMIAISGTIQCYGNSYTLGVSADNGDSDEVGFQLRLMDENTELRAEVERLKGLLNQEEE